ncbi:B-cell lymphoma/leukemia 10 [Danio aesculapii]|uniref:B-cell lymphoma/leukemia 10 n=1 Tax=Danio aesculapii TaxID=1142201 RepID=UPI0024C001E6|nr:B-cell lymphoma/leukemia 10 [Danio aesculapii]
MDVTHLTEDEMADIKKEAIERLRPYLVDKIIADRHFDYLRSKKILTREDTEEISCRTTRGKRTSKLLDILAENPRGLDMLIESIKWGRTLNFIIARITDEVQRVKNERLEALKAVSNSAYSTTKGATNDFSKMDSDYDKYSTMCLHPEGEASSSSSVATGSFNLRFGSTRGNEALSVCGGSGTINVSSTSSILPKPGDPGAPALPEEMENDEQDIDGGVCKSAGSSGDANFQPLRSRSLSPQTS